MNKNTEQKYIYITPFLDEVERVKKGCSQRYFYEPSEKLGKGSKYRHFVELLREGKNIVSTHSLFRNIDKEVIELLKEHNYILILDEVLNVIEKVNINRTDLEMLEDKKIISIKDNKILWLDNEYNGDLAKYKNSILNGDMYLLNDCVIMWTFPVNIFESFKHIYIMTFLFKGQLQRYYYDMYNIEYEYKSIKATGYGDCRTYELVDYKEADTSKLKKLINIYEGKYNLIGEGKGKENPLSFSWFDRAIKNKSDKLDVLSNNMSNYFKNSCKETLPNGKKKAYQSKYNCWTVPKGLVYKSDEKRTKWTVKRNSTNYLSWNIRATNEYRHKVNIAYCVNLFLNPIDANFFKSKGVNIDEDTWALGEMIQFIFRTRIRDGKPINIYIPSKRMRNLLKSWLNNEK